VRLPLHGFKAAPPARPADHAGRRGLEAARAMPGPGAGARKLILCKANRFDLSCALKVN